MNNTSILFAIFGVLLIGASLAIAAPADKEASWLKNIFTSEELADLESKEGSDDAAPIEKRPSWVSGRDLSDYYK